MLFRSRRRGTEGGAGGWGSDEEEGGAGEEDGASETEWKSEEGSPALQF